MSSRWVGVLALAMWAGASCVLMSVPWFARRSLADRIRRYVPGGAATELGGRGSAVESIIGPLTGMLDTLMARFGGADAELQIRLSRARRTESPTDFRQRQLALSVLALLGGGTLAAVLGFTGASALVLVLAPPVATALSLENSVNSEAARYQSLVLRELPVVAEQLGMLLSAGYSLAAGLNRVAHRGRGAVSRDLRVAVRRIGHGVPENQALVEWARLTGVPALERLVTILALNREAGDLGAMITEEARSIRRELHRDVLEQIEKRSQTVWIPVTVATLVPGVIFLAIPFSATLARFSG